MTQIEYCPDCGKESLEGANYCHSCGEDLDNYNRENKADEYCSEEKPTREGYRRILNEELEKAEEPDHEDEQEKGEAEKELEKLLKENPNLYNTLSEIEQKIIDGLGLKPK